VGQQLTKVWLIQCVVQSVCKRFLLFKSFALHTHTFNGPFSGTTRVSRYQKGKTNLDFTEARDSEWQWHQLGHMQVSTSLQTDNHDNTPPLSFYRPDALPAAQPTASKYWRHKVSPYSWVKITILLTISVMSFSTAPSSSSLSSTVCSFSSSGTASAAAVQMHKAWN